MLSALKDLATPYASPEAAARARVHEAAAMVLSLSAGFAVAILGLLVSDSPASAAVRVPGTGAFAAAGPVVVILLAASQRKKLEAAAGRKLQARELTAVRDATAAGQMVAEPGLRAAQEYFARRHMTVTTAYVTGFVTLVLVVLPFALLLWLGGLPPLAFASAALLVSAGILYGARGVTRRAAGAAVVNAAFGSPVSPEEARAEDAAPEGPS